MENLRGRSDESVESVVDERKAAVDSDEAPSSSGLGHQVLILKIAGSNPAGVTKARVPRLWGFYFGHSCRMEYATRVRWSEDAHRNLFRARRSEKVSSPVMGWMCAIPQGRQSAYAQDH